MSEPLVLSIAQLKQRAHDIKKQTGERHCRVLEAIAQQYGYRTWAALLAAANGSTHVPAKTSP